MSSKLNPIPNDKVFNKRESVVSNSYCADCNSLCCHDLVMEIESPTSDDDLQTLMWYLHFKHSFIFINDSQWYHMIRSECRFLSKVDKLCKNYERRTNKCIEHTPPNCERYESWYEQIFDDPYMLEEYVQKNKLIKEKKISKKNAKKNK